MRRIRMITATNRPWSLRDDIHIGVDVLVMAQHVNRFAIDAIEDILIVGGRRPATAVYSQTSEQKNEGEQDVGQTGRFRCHCANRGCVCMMKCKCRCVNRCTRVVEFTSCVVCVCVAGLCL